MTTIDLNADLGEGAPYDEALLQIVSSANIACGGHAGDADTMARTVQMAIANGVAVGAHPGYLDPGGFGRESGFMRGDALYASLIEQVTRLADIAAQQGARLAHVKPHGALYNARGIREAARPRFHRRGVYRSCLRSRRHAGVPQGTRRRARGS